MSWSTCFKRPESRCHNGKYILIPYLFKFAQKDIAHINSPIRTFSPYLAMATLSRLEPKLISYCKDNQAKFSYGCLHHALREIGLYTRLSQGASSPVHLFRSQSPPMTSILVRKSRGSITDRLSSLHDVFMPMLTGPIFVDVVSVSWTKNPRIA